MAEVENSLKPEQGFDAEGLLFSTKDFPKV